MLGSYLDDSIIIPYERANVLTREERLVFDHGHVSADLLDLTEEKIIILLGAVLIFSVLIPFTVSSCVLDCEGMFFKFDPLFFFVV